MTRGRLHLPDDVRELEYTIGQSVRLRRGSPEVVGTVTGYEVRRDGVLYLVAWMYAGADRRHYGFELSPKGPRPRASE